MKAKDLTPAQALRAAVEDVKNLKPAEIAAALARKKIVGRPGTTGRCPLALLMHNSHGGRFVVGQKYIMREGGGSVEQVKTPPNLAAFVRMFDSGAFQNLIQVPPRCLPVRLRPAPKPSGKNRPSGKEHKYKRGAERLQLAKQVQRFKYQSAAN